MWHTPCFDTPFSSGWNIGAVDSWTFLLCPWVSLEDMLSWSYSCFQPRFQESGLVVGYLILVLLISCAVSPKVQFNYFPVRSHLDWPIQKKKKLIDIQHSQNGIMLENFPVAHKFQLSANVIRQSLWDKVWWCWVHATIASKNK